MAHADIDQLLNVLIALAQDLLAEHGEFIPFGASMSTDGEVNAAMAETGEEHPCSQEVFDVLTDGFRKAADEGAIRAAGICLDVRTTPPGAVVEVDAICTRLEHEGGEVVDAFLPYHRDEAGEITYGKLFAAAGERSVFGSDIADPEQQN
ncbi:MAG: hypothetical protein ABIJ56_22240 [Pseudomonadota bacterium]